MDLIPTNATFKGYYLFPLLFYMPNLHFWSCGVGKDTLLFFCIGLFSYGWYNNVPFKELAEMLWDSETQALFASIIAFHFGGRAFGK